LVKLSDNYGFCGGNNRGIVTAEGQYIVLLNNDTEAHPRLLEELYEAIERHPEVGFCATRMLNFFDRSRIDNCGIGLHISGKGYQIGSGKMNGARFDKMRYVFGASGGAVLYRRNMLEKIGVLYEDLFSHIEDTDLSWRAQLAGYRCLYVPTAIIYHIGGATSQRVSEQVLYRIQRNITLVYMRNITKDLILLTIFPHFLNSLYWLLRGMKSGQVRLVWQAKIDALRAWPSIRKQRSKIQANRRLSFLTLLKMIDWQKT